MDRDEILSKLEILHGERHGIQRRIRLDQAQPGDSERLHELFDEIDGLNLVLCEPERRAHIQLMERIRILLDS